jgi:L-fuculose-phosphate aldolase
MSSTDRTARYALARRLVDTAREMNACGLNQGTSGNLSARFGEGLLITPSGIDYARMRPADIVHIRLDGSAAEAGQLLPSSEWRMHADIYAERKDAVAVVHAHPTYATAIACRREGIPAFHYMVAVAGGADIRCAEYATFGTGALSRSMMRALEGRKACLLANHGLIAFERSPERALALAVEVEALARQYHISRQGGEPVLLSATEMTEVLEKFKIYGKQSRGE